MTSDNTAIVEASSTHCIRQAAHGTPIGIGLIRRHRPIEYRYAPSRRVRLPNAHQSVEAKRHHFCTDAPSRNSQVRNSSIAPRYFFRQIPLDDLVEIRGFRVVIVVAAEFVIVPRTKPTNFSRFKEKGHGVFVAVAFTNLRFKLFAIVSRPTLDEIHVREIIQGREHVGAYLVLISGQDDQPILLVAHHKCALHLVRPIDVVLFPLGQHGGAPQSRRLEQVHFTTIGKDARHRLSVDRPLVLLLVRTSLGIRALHNEGDLSPNGNPTIALEQAVVPFRRIPAPPHKAGPVPDRADVLRLDGKRLAARARQPDLVPLALGHPRSCHPLPAVEVGTALQTAQRHPVGQREGVRAPLRDELRLLFR